LSEPVQAAVEEAVKLVESVVGEIHETNSKRRADS